MVANGGKREGAGRKPKYGSGPSVQLSHRMPPELVAALRARAKADGVSAGEVIVRSLRAYLGAPPHQTEDSENHAT